MKICRDWPLPHLMELMVCCCCIGTVTMLALECYYNLICCSFTYFFEYLLHCFIGSKLCHYIYFDVIRIMASEVCATNMRWRVLCKALHKIWKGLVWWQDAWSRSARKTMDPSFCFLVRLFSNWMIPGFLSCLTWMLQMMHFHTDRPMWLNRRNVNGDWVVATPDTCSMSVDEGVEFVIVASDGLWDSFKRWDLCL